LHQFKPRQWFQIAHHTRGYVHERWGDLFEVVGYLPRGLNNHQDLVILRKPDSSAVDRARRTETRRARHGDTLPIPAPQTVLSRPRVVAAG
jgi:hypothetical protein